MRTDCRLDIGHSDYVYRKQLEAMSFLNNNPLEQDVSDYVEDSFESYPQFPLDMPKKNPLVVSTPSSAAPSNQAILKGTSLRETLLRAFSKDFRPPVPSASSPSDSSSPISNAKSDGFVSNAHALSPTDLDAIPKPHLASGTGETKKSGILNRNTLIRSWAERHRSERETPVEVEGDPYVPLNRTQLRAMGMMLSEALSLVQGVSYIVSDPHRI